MKNVGLIISNNLAGLLVMLGIVAVVFLIYMLFRIISEQDSIYKEIKKGTHNLIEAGEKLQGMYAIAENLINKVKELRSSISSQAIDDIEFIFKDFTSEHLKKIENIILEMKTHITAMNSTSPEELPRWREKNIQAISKLLADQTTISPDITKLQNSLDQVLTDLKSTYNIIADDSNSQKKLEQKLKSYQIMVMKAREKSRNAENAIAELESEIFLLRSQNVRKNSEPTNAIEELQNELNKIILEKSSLLEKLDILTNEINRTKIEKDFIEDKFIELS